MNRSIVRFFKRNWPYILAWFIIFAFCNSLEYITDDWHFHFVFTGFEPLGDERRVQNFGDVFESIKNYYNMSGGRAFAHGVLYCILMFPKYVFNVINAFMFVLMSYLVGCLGCEEKEKKCKTNAFVLLLLFLFLPSFGDTCLWISGSTNYLWMTIFPLLFILCFLKQRYCLSLIFGLISGFTNEATGGMILVFMFVWIMLNKQKIRLIYVLHALCVIPGLVFILAAPGNYNRANVINETSVFAFGTTIIMLGRTFLWLLKSFGIFMIISVLIVSYLLRKFDDTYKKSIPFLISSLSGMGALAVSGTFFERAQFLNVIFLLIAFIQTTKSFIRCVKENQQVIKWKIGKYINYSKGLMYFRVLIGITIILIMAFLGFNTMGFVNAVKMDHEKIEKIENAKKANQEKVVVSKNYHYTGGHFYPAEGSVSKNYEAKWMAEYYGISIILTF